MKTVNIEIHTRNPMLIIELLSKPSLPKGEEIQILPNEIQISDQIVLRHKGSYIEKAAYSPEIIYLALGVASGIAFSLASDLTANLLYDKLKGEKETTLIIERTEVEIDQGEIKRVIREKLEAQK